MGEQIAAASAMDEQTQVVLAVLKDELPLAEVACRYGASSATVGN